MRVSPRFFRPYRAGERGVMTTDTATIKIIRERHSPDTFFCPWYRSPSGEINCNSFFAINVW